MSSWSSILEDVQKNWLLYLSMPIIAAIIGYSTKLIAVEMMFKPTEFKGRRPFLGWQGIIPRFAGRMAAIACDTLTTKLLNPKDLFDRLDPERVVAEIEQPLIDTIREVAEQIASRTQPEVWNSLPAMAQNRILEQFRRDVPRVVAEIMTQIKDNIDVLFDFKEMVVTNLVQDKETLNQMFRLAGRRAFRFIVNFGAPSGFAIGVIQAGAWAVFREPLIMPAFGLLTGWLTDYIALKLVFAPKYPKRILGLFTWQGLFFKHRIEFTDIYGDLVARQVVTPSKVITAVLQGPASDRVFAVIQRKVNEEMDRQIGMGRPLVMLAVGGAGYRQVKDIVASSVIARLPETAKQLQGYAEDALDIRNTIVLKMREMTADDFEQLLRPAFKQDEWKLIAVGAVLGFLVGELQTLLVETFAR
ncbi:MAG TPA: DUF445 domain-containing protein [Pseudonocardia sp.]